MLEAPLFNIEGKQIGKEILSEKVFGCKVKKQVIYDAMRWFQASQRQGTHSTKTRAEVSGGGKKPWKQKGTGRARAGSNRSPLWKKGGVVFGPKPRDYSYSLPKKVRKLALKMALSDKAAAQRVSLLENLQLKTVKTKQAAKLFKDMGIAGKVLCIAAAEPADFKKAARNLEGFCFSLAQELNIYDLLRAENIVVDKNSLPALEEMFSAA